LKHAGEVWLIGAGPGDPGLLTLKGLEGLQRADLVLYDNLVNTDLLRLAKTEARRIYVGKKGGERSWTQGRINRLLVSEAKKGNRIARLKGGDPNIFGRGAEEAVFLSRHKIPFRVVPGVTSGIACATYAGIPLTERNLSSSVAFLTGHGAGKGALPEIKWKPLVQAVDTIVVYMGLSKISDITTNLLDAGLASATPAAVIEWGTWSRQKTCFSTLGRIAGDVASKKILSPAIFVVGRVVDLHASLGWFEKLPLFGKTVLLTRSESQSLPLRHKLESLGASVAQVHALKITEPSDARPLRRAVQNIGDFDWAVFTSPNGVDSFFAALHSVGYDSRALATLRIASVGTTTAEKLLAHGIRSDFMPTYFTSKDMLEELRARENLRGKKILFLRSQIAPRELIAQFEAAGAEAVHVTAYETHCPTKEIRSELSAALAQNPQILTFTSSSTVTHLFAAADPKDLKRLLKEARIVSIGPITSATLKRHGIEAHREAKVHTAQGLVDAIIAEAHHHPKLASVRSGPGILRRPEAASE